MTVVLLVEDEGDVLSTLAESLEKKGYEVITACDGEDALTPGKLDRADIVVTDMRMPRLDGVGLYRAAQVQRPQLPFIFISGHMVDIEFKEPAQGRPQPILLHKPFAAQALIVAIERQLKLA